MSTVRKMWKTVVAMILACIALPTVCHSAIVQLPSCLVPPEQADNNPLIAWVEVKIDSHGNFYAPWVSDVINWTALETYGVPVWARRFGPGVAGSWGVDYYTTAALEQKICARGKQIILQERSDFRGVKPKPYTLVRELQTVANTSDQQLYFLSSIGADTDFVLRGFVGGGWSSTSNEFRLPRAGDDLVPVHRFFGVVGTGTPSHLYTADEVEVANISSMAVAGGKLSYDGIVFMAPKAIATSDGVWTCSSANYAPVRRLYAPSNKPDVPARYRYVADESITMRMRAAGWQDQGAAFCALRD